MEIPNQLISEIPSTKPLYTAVYLYALSQATAGKLAICLADYGNLFNVLETDIVAAFQHWQAKMFLHLKFTNHLEIEFINKVATQPTAGPVVVATSKAETIDAFQEDNPPKNLVFLSNTPKPTYSPMELEMYKNKYGNIAHIFNIAEKSLGRLLSANELSTVFSFYDWLRLPIDVIEVLLQYCATNGHRNINYIESVAIDWSENKIITVELAENHIQSYNKNYREVLKALGQSGREATKKERGYIDKWLTDFNLSLDIILEACDKTIMNVGKPQFSYTDKILETWYQNGVSSIADIITLENKFKALKSTAQPQAKPNAPTAKSKFANYTSSSQIDYNEIENMELALMKNLLKG